MEICAVYTAEYNLYGDKEEIRIARYPNGKYFIHYGWMESENCGVCVAGGFDSFQDAENMMKKHRPTAEPKRIAESFNGFIDTVSEAERKILNSEIGQEITKSLLAECLRKNPRMTEDEWSRKKSELMTFIFCMFVKENPAANREFAHHLYDELRKE